MSQVLADQIVLVSGAGRGLGAAIAAAFAREGARVAINYRHSKDQAEALAARLGERTLAVAGEVRDASAVRAMV